MTKVNKKIILASLVLISIFSQAGPQTSYYSGVHDSLLFDGSNGNANFFNNMREECNIKVTKVKGEVWGSILTADIEQTCGEYDTVYKITYEKVKVGDILVSEGFVRTKDFSMVELEMRDGKQVWLGPATEFKMGRDYCMGKGTAELFSGTVHVKGGTEGKTYVSTPRSMVNITKTEYTVETVNDGGNYTDIIRMYEGSVTFGLNMQNEALSKQNDEKAAEMSKLSEDYHSGKISLMEFSQKIEELKNDIFKTTPQSAIIINAGFESRIVGLESPTEPVPFDTNENRWWEK